MTLQASKEPKNRQFLMLLSAIVLVFFLISSLSTFFMHYRHSGLRFYFPGVLATLIFLINAAVRAATVAYFANLYKHEKSKQMLVGIFAAYTVMGVLILLSNIINQTRYGFAVGIFSVIFSLLNVLIYGLFTLNVHTDGKLKVLALLFAILNLVVSAFGFLGQIITVIEYLDRGLWFYAITNLASGITSLTFALFLVVFAASYSATAAASVAKAPAALSGPERLQLLFQEYQKGNLTEEEFQAKRQEIIENF